MVSNKCFNSFLGRALLLMLLFTSLNNCARRSFLPSSLQESIPNLGNKNASGSKKQDGKPNTSTNSDEIWKPLVVFLHGHQMDNTQGNPEIGVKDKLEKRLGKEIEVFFPTCREGNKSDELSIYTQADKLIEEITQHLEERFKKLGFTKQKIEDNVKDVPLYIIGNSQGGLVAIMIGYKITKNRNHKLSIKGIITCSSPLTGLCITQPSPYDTWSFVRKMNAILPSNYHILGNEKSDLIMAPLGFCLAYWFPGYFGKRYGLLQGLTDMRPGSKTLAKAGKFINDPTHGIAILLIAGTTEKMSKYIDPNTEASKIPDESKHLFDQTYALVITGKKDGKHDGVIALDSQLCQKDGMTFNENVKDIVQDDGNVRRITLGGNYMHCYSFMLNGKLSFHSKGDKIAIESDKAAKHIAEFIKLHK